MKWFGILIGTFFIMTVCGNPIYAGRDGRSDTASHSYWVNPDGAHGIFGEPSTPPLDLPNHSYWVNPDGIGGTLRGAHTGRLEGPKSDDWVNPDGFRGAMSVPLNISASRIEATK